MQASSLEPGVAPDVNEPLPASTLTVDIADAATGHVHATSTLAADQLTALRRSFTGAAAASTVMTWPADLGQPGAATDDDGTAGVPARI